MQRLGISFDEGGHFTTQGADVAQGIVSNGQLEDILAVDVTHLGRAGDTDVELASLEIRLEDDMQIPLASAQANALIEGRGRHGPSLRVVHGDG